MIVPVKLVNSQGVVVMGPDETALHPSLREWDNCDESEYTAHARVLYAYDKNRNRYCGVEAAYRGRVAQSRKSRLPDPDRPYPSSHEDKDTASTMTPSEGSLQETIAETKLKVCLKGRNREHGS